MKLYCDPISTTSRPVMMFIHELGLDVEIVNIDLMSGGNAARRSGAGVDLPFHDFAVAEFDAFEASARSGTSNVLDALAQLIASFSADVRVETETE